MKNLKFIFTSVLIVLILFSGGCATKKKDFRDAPSGGSAGNTSQGVKAPVSVSGAEEFVYEFDVMVDVDPQKMAEPRPDYPESVPPAETRSADTYGQQSQQSQLTQQPQRQSQLSSGTGNDIASSGTGSSGSVAGGATGGGAAGSVGVSGAGADPSSAGIIAAGGGVGSGAAGNGVGGTGSTGTTAGSSAAGGSNGVGAASNTGSTGSSAGSAGSNTGSAGSSMAGGGVGIGGPGTAGTTAGSSAAGGSGVGSDAEGSSGTAGSGTGTVAAASYSAVSPGSTGNNAAGDRAFGSPGGPGGRERRNTNLVGPGSVNVEGVMDYIKIRNRNPVINEESTRRIINSYIDEAVKEDVNYDFAIAQMLYWTAFLTHKQRVESNNLAGLQATNEWRGTFPTAEEGVQAHIQHLRGYSHRTLKDPNAKIIDPRWNVISDFRGTIKNFEQIYPRWSASTARYRRNIILILNDMYRYSDRYSNLYR